MLAQRQKTEEKYSSVIHCLANTAFEISNYLQNFKVFSSALVLFSVSEEFMVIFYCTFWKGSFTFIALDIGIWTYPERSSLCI